MSDDEVDSVKSGSRHVFWAVLILLGITVGLFGDLLFLPGDGVLSHVKGDTAQHHFFMRDLGAEEISKGNLPLWNPYVFSGMPFLGSMQSGLLYPPNAIYLFLPIHKAVNFDFAAHLFLMGVFTFLWMRSWGVHWVGALYAAVLTMLCGATYLRILAGQLNVVASLTWFPLLLICIDQAVKHASWRRFPSVWVLLGVASTTLLLHAGYPQALFICAVSAAIYSLARLPQARHKIPSAVELGVIGGLPVFLGAIQLWTGVSIGIESIRGNELSYEFASSFSLPPEKFVTLFAPGFFGDNIRVWQLGRWGFWDDSFFVGSISLLFFFYGFRSPHKTLKRVSMLVFAFTLLIALGRYIPFHKFFFDYVPGFDKFRAPSKFLFVTSFFLAAVAGLGVDRLVTEGRRRRLFGAVALLCGLAMFGAAGVFMQAGFTEEDGRWWQFVADMKATPDTYVWVDVTRELVEQSAALARNNFLVAGGILLVFGVALLNVRRGPWWMYGAVGVGVVELLIFAYAYRGSFPASDLGMNVLDDVAESLPEEERMFCVSRWHRDESNYAVGHRAHSAWGYDPVKLNRYGQFVATLSTGYDNKDTMEEHLFDWGTGPMAAGVNLGFLKFTPEGTTHSDTLFQLLRCRYVVKLPIAEEFHNYLNFVRTWGLVWPEDASYIADDAITVHEVENLLSRFSMIRDYRVVSDREEMLQALDAADFDPHSSVLLESEPQPVPEGSGGGDVIAILDESTDHITLEVEAATAGILLVTDAYSDGWKATALPGSVQEKYEVMPANLALRGIPLSAGKHRFRLEYLPDAFVYGRMASIGGLFVFLLLAVACYLRRNNGEAASDVGPPSSDVPSI